MRALLLAAGLGTRLRPVTNTVPKCLVEINGRPLLDHWIELLSEAIITDMLVNLHYLPEKVHTYLAGCKYPANISTVMEANLLGTAGTLLKNREFFKREPVMLIHADNLSLFDVRAFIERFEQRDKNINVTMMTFYADKPETCGIVELNEAGTVCAFHEKVKSPHGNLANAAVYILAPSVIDFIASLGREAVDFSTEVLPHYMGHINTFHNGVYHRDIGTVESLALAQSEYPTAVARRRSSGTGQAPA
jgi:mannose-1-phosphate guanylyltransferase